MLKYIRKRLTGLVIVLIGVTVLSFIFSNISTVDPAEALARRTMLNPDTMQIEEIRKEMGLNLPLYLQYFKWLKECLKGNLGTSLITRNPISMDIGKKLPVTLAIVGMAFVWIILLTVPVSILSAINKNNRLDHTIRVITILGISIPNFWLGLLLLLTFAVTIPFFRVVDYGNFKSLILPSLTLAIPTISSSIRLFRANILSNLNKDFVIYARSRGISEKNIIWKHVVKNSLPPLITVTCQNLGYMVAGSAIVENIFSWPGIGSHLVDAIIARDLPTINACVLLIAVIFVFCNLFADILNTIIDPKMLSTEGEL